MALVVTLMPFVETEVSQTQDDLRLLWTPELPFSAAWEVITRTVIIRQEETSEWVCSKENTNATTRISSAHRVPPWTSEEKIWWLCLQKSTALSTKSIWVTSQKSKHLIEKVKWMTESSAKPLFWVNKVGLGHSRRAKLNFNHMIRALEISLMICSY